MTTKQEALKALEVMNENEYWRRGDFSNEIETIRQYIKTSQDVPEGYIIVPVDPTGPMIMYGIHAHEKNDDLPDIGLGPKCVGIYKAMTRAFKSIS